MRNLIFENNNFYHVFNRGVDKRVIFQTKRDYCKFIAYLYECGFKEAIPHLNRRTERFDGITNKTGKSRALASSDKRRLIHIVCFCLMPNHFHLLLEQSTDNGISKFMHRLSTGYVHYYNIKNKRTGALFEGRFKAKHIKTDEYLTHLSRYIHLNPIELIEPGWKDSRIKNWSGANNFLEEYKWSSYLDYIERKNFPLVINKDFLIGCFENGKEYKRFINEWLLRDLDEIEDLIIE